MNYKKSLIFIGLIICMLFSISSVVAIDLENTTQELTEETTFAANELSFTDLSGEINSGKNEIVLESDYKYDSNKDGDYKDGVSIGWNTGNQDKLMIDGNGHTIDGNCESKIFSITKANVTLKNIVFKNIYSTSTKTNGAIYWSASNGVLENCTFSDISVKYGVAAVDSYGKNFVINNCNFINNNAKSQILVIYGEDSKVSSCNFVNNSAGYSGVIQFTYSSSRSQLTKCNFVNNSAGSGGVIYWNGNEGSMTDCILDYSQNNFDNSIISWKGDEGYVNNGIYDFKVLVHNETINDYESYDEYSMIYIKNMGSQTGNISIYLNNILCYNKKINSFGYLYIYPDSLDKLQMGDLDVVIKFTSNGKTEEVYNGLLNIDYLIRINDYEYEEEVSDTAIFYDNLKLSVDLPNDVNGKLTVNYNGKIKEITYDKWGRGKFVLPATEFTIDTHKITLNLIDDDIYPDKSVDYYIKIIPGQYVPEVISVGESDKILFEFPKNYSGAVSVYNASFKEFDDEYYYYNDADYEKNQLIASSEVIDGKALIQLTGLKLGRNLIVINCTGDGNYEEYYYVDVIKNNANINAGFESNSIKLGESAVLKITAPRSSNDVLIYIDNVLYKESSLSNGEITEYLSNLALGEHKIKLLFRDYDEEDNCEYTYSNTLYLTVKEKQKATVLTAKSVIEDYNSQGYLIATLKDTEGNALGNIDVSININNEIKNLTTDEYGQVKFSVLGLIPNNYDALIAFAGNDNYLGSSVSANVVIKKIRTDLTATNVNTVYNGGKYVLITLKGADGIPINDTFVKIQLNGDKYLKTDANGQIKLATNNLDPEEYVVTITFAGDVIFDSSSTTSIVVVKKATPKFTAKAKTIKRTDKTKKYTVTLKTNQNKVMKSKTVKITVNKKTYTAKTNSKGVATFKLTKLTKKGKYSATVKFGGDKYYVSKSVKVKITIK